MVTFVCLKRMIRKEKGKYDEFREG